MKKTYSLIMSILMMFAFTAVISTDVKAEPTIAELKVEARSSSGDRTEIALSPAFSPDVKEYNATVMHDVIALDFTVKTTEEDATYDTDWEALDVGDNKSYVYVRDSEGNRETYTIYTKRLTAEEEETYEPQEPETEPQDTEQNVTVEVDGVQMSVSGDFTDADIPEGFSKTTVDYNGQSVPAIKGDVKKITAMWLKPVDENSEVRTGFYIYRQNKKDFKVMKNVYIKSRMYTVVDKADIDKFLSPYDKATINMGGEDVEAWILDKENNLYLIYAMNWDGQTNLYCYDDIEKCFQRYIVDSAADTQLQSANDAINRLQDKYNALTDKYNKSNSIKWKTIAVLGVLIVILFFVCLNLALKIATNKVTDEEDDDVPAKSGNDNVEKDFYEDKHGDDDDVEDDDELFKLVEETEDETEDDFIIFDDAPESEDEQEGDPVIVDGDKTIVGTRNQDFNIDMDEIDISAQVRKEMEAIRAERLSRTSDEDAQKNKSKAAEKETVDTEFSDDENDDDGFTFI